MSETLREVLETLAKVLLRCWIIGFVLIFIWFFGIPTMDEWIYSLFDEYGLSTHELDLIFVGFIGLVRLFVAIFFFIPWLAIWMVLKKTQSTT